MMLLVVALCCFLFAGLIAKYYKVTQDQIPLSYLLLAIVLFVMAKVFGIPLSQLMVF